VGDGILDEDLIAAVVGDGVVEELRWSGGFNSLLYSSVISAAICWSILVDSAPRSAPAISTCLPMYVTAMRSATLSAFW